MLKYKKTMLINLLLIFLSLAVVFPVGAQKKANEPNVVSTGQHDHYKIGANDLLNIFVWKEPDLTQDVQVMPDGRITFPMIGEVMAEGKSVIELKNTLEDRLKDYVSSPEVTVIIRASNSKIIYTIGKITKPGPYPLAPDMTVLQALSTAGGFAEWADIKNIMIVRKSKMFKFNYQDFITGKNIEQNILLEPGDTIVVP